MTKPTFTLYLNKSSATNIVGSTTIPGNITYDINWNTVIPIDYVTRQFLVSTTFTSAFTTVVIQRSGMIFANLGTTNVSTGKAQSTFLAVYNQRTTNEVSGTSTQGHLTSNASDNMPITIGYPSNNLLNIIINSVDGESMYGVSSYVLILTFTLIDE